MGNKLNVNENDLLGYLIQDEGTKIILVYLEGFKDARRFTEVASTSTKPILVHKSNRFEASARIAHSHTAALFADDRLVDYALEQAGAFASTPWMTAWTISSRRPCLLSGETALWLSQGPEATPSSLPMLALTMVSPFHAFLKRY